MQRIFEGAKDFDYVNELIGLACNHLNIDSDEIIISFERIGNTFQDIKIGAVTDDSGKKMHIIINMDWYENVDEQDVKFIIWHETYHAYQFIQIRNVKFTKAAAEPLEKIRLWEFERKNYIPNTPITENRHFGQSLEADAYYFSLAMIYRYSCNSDGSIDIGISPVLEKNFDIGVGIMIEKYFKPTTTKNITQNIGRNDPCPCGSGKKYKKCCGKHPSIK